jgi:hydroxyacid-oxoacid transhydrogenase
MVSSIFTTMKPFVKGCTRLANARGSCRLVPLGLGRRAFTQNTEQGNDPICELAASNLRFGPGSTAEVGADLKEVLSASRVVVFTDPTVNTLPCMQVLLESLDRHGIENVVYDQVRVEPNDVSFQHAIQFLSNTEYDAVVALGGGSVLDTAKAANLYATFPPENFYDYVNPPVGKGMPVPGASEGALPPLIAIPTTAGTGSETTGVAIFDDTATKSKTGIANRRLKPTLGIVDPDNTITLPKEVACYSGLDVLCHAMESYTALPFNQRAKPSSPTLRPAYQGSNPISDVWSMFALETSAKYLALVAKDPENEEARAQMLLASSSAGMGFGTFVVILVWFGMNERVLTNPSFTFGISFQEMLASICVME